MIEMTPIGIVRSSLSETADAPRQGDEGAPAARLVFDAAVLEGLRDIRPGDRLVLLTWLHRARRDVLRVHPRDETANPLTGVFSTRSADRPNPIGIHEVEVIAVEHLSIEVRPLEAIDGTPILDVKAKW